MPDGLADALHFLEIIFADKADTDYIVIWCKYPEGHNRTFCFRELEEAADLGCMEVAKGADVYFGVGPLYLDLTGQPRRGKKPDIVGLSCVWLDLDVGVEGHKKDNLFPTTQAARDFLVEVDLTPTILVSSGGGLQAYFCFERMRRIQDDADREWLDRLSQGFQQKVRRESLARVNCEIDMTGDISRILRLPGTVNQKYAHKPRVEVIEYNPTALFNLDQLTRFVNLAPADLLDSPKLPPYVPQFTSITHLELPNSCKLLMDLEPRFKAALFREGGTLAGKTSDSEYDLSIASQAVRHGVNDAEIAATISWSRKNFGHDEDARSPKYRRMDYIERTIRKAHSNTTLPTAFTEFAAKDGEIADGTKIEVEPDRDYLLRQVSIALGIEILSVRSFGGEAPIWQLETPNGQITIGTPQRLMSWQHVSAQVLGQEHRLLKRMKTKEWYELVDLLGKLVHVIDVGDLASDKIWMRNKIAEFVWAARTIEYSDDASAWSPASSLPHVLCKDDERWIYLDNFAAWLWHQNQQARLPARPEWGRVLVGLGMKPAQILVEHGEMRVRQWFWSVPKQMLE